MAVDDHSLLDIIDEQPHDVSDTSEIVQLKETIKRLEADNERLAEIVKFLQPEPVGDAYPLDQFMLALAVRRGCTYGWRKDYADATQNTPGSFLVSTEDIQKWQREKRVPAQAFAQISWLVYPTRTGRAGSKPTWKAMEVDYLFDLCRANPLEQNAVLAQRCTDHFHRDIDESAIKGKKYRLIKAGRLPECDPVNK